MKISIFFFLIAGLLLSCSDKSATSVPADTISDVAGTEAEVLRIHDEVMPKMSDIQRLASQLRERKNTAPKDDSGNPKLPDGLESQLTKLKQAESVMMDWMKQYGEQRAKINDQTAEAFYKAELEKINQVKTFMLTAIEEANQWLTNNPA